MADHFDEDERFGIDMDTLPPSHAVLCSQYLIEVDQELPRNFMEEDEEIPQLETSEEEVDMNKGKTSTELQEDKKVLDIYLNRVGLGSSDVENLNLLKVTLNCDLGEDRHCEKVQSNIANRKDNDNGFSVVDQYMFEDIIVNLIDGDEFQAARHVFKDRWLRGVMSNFKMFVVQPKALNKKELNLAETDQTERKGCEGTGLPCPPESNVGGKLPVVKQCTKKSTACNKGKHLRKEVMEKTGRCIQGRHSRRTRRKMMIDNHVNTKQGKDKKVGGAVCELCNKSYVHISNLTRHRSIVHKQIRHSCDYCGMQFTRTDSLQGHLKNNKCKNQTLSSLSKHAH